MATGRPSGVIEVQANRARSGGSSTGVASVVMPDLSRHSRR